MAYLIGMLLGHVGFFRAAGAALVLGGLALVAHSLVAANLDPARAWIAAIAAPLVLFGWAFWSPAASRFRLWIVNGVYLAVRLGMWWNVGAMGDDLVLSHFRIGEWVAKTWPAAVMAALFWSMQWLLASQVGRSHRRLGDRSVVGVDA